MPIFQCVSEGENWILLETNKSCHFFCWGDAVTLKVTDRLEWWHFYSELKTKLIKQLKTTSLAIILQ